MSANMKNFEKGHFFLGFSAEEYYLSAPAEEAFIYEESW